MMVSSLLCIPILRHRYPSMKRPFKTLFPLFGPVITSLIYIGIIVSWLLHDPLASGLFKLGLSILFLGIPIYFLIEMYFSPRSILFVNDMLAYITYFGERYSLPKKVLDSFEFILGDINGKHILEYGSSVGTVTLLLAKKTGPKGKIYALDHSKRSLEILKKRISKRDIKHVEVLHDENHLMRVHPDLKKVDLIVSVGVLGFVQDIKKVIKEMNTLLPIGGEICLMDYDKFFGLIPNTDWVADNEFIKKSFIELGFKIDITRTKGLFWEYVFIYGDKIKEV